MKATIFSSYKQLLISPFCSIFHQTSIMAPKTTLLISFLLLFYICSVGGSSGDGANPVYSLHKDGFRIHARKLSMLDAVLDYDDAGANPKHDIPRRGRGGGGRTP